MAFNSLQDRFGTRMKYVPSLEKAGSLTVSNPYEGAGNKNMVDWNAWDVSANSAVRAGLPWLRARSQDLCRNTEVARQVIRLLRENVIGKGIKLQAQVTKLNGDLDNELNIEIEKEWKYWSKNCDVSGRLNLNQLQRQVMGTLAQDGEVFIRIVKRSRNGSLPLQLQIIQSQQVDLNYIGEKTSNKNQWILGVEVNPWLEPIRYAVLTHMPSDVNVYSRKHILIPARDMLHIHLKSEERPNQFRGIPFIFSSIATIRRLYDYVHIEGVRAKGAASLMAFIQSEGPVDSYSSNDESTNYAAEQFRAGGLLKLDPGDSAHIPNINSPSGQFQPYIQSVNQMIAAGCGVSYASLTSDYSKSNYSSSRLSAIEQKETYKIMQDEIIDMLLEPVYEKFLPLALLKLGVDFTNFDRLQTHSFNGRGWSFIDPQKEVKAHADAVNSGFTTVTRVLADQGYDIEEVLLERKKELELAESMGISLSNTIKEEPQEIEEEEEKLPEDK